MIVTAQPAGRDRMRVRWNPEPKPTNGVYRRHVNPAARAGHEDVSLAWLKKHAEQLTYRVRWWEGETDTKGEWHELTFPAKHAFKEVQNCAACIAAISTPWPVEITLQASMRRDYDKSDRPSVGIVWMFGTCERIKALDPEPVGKSDEC